MEHVLGTLISTTWLIVVIGDLPYTLGPIRRKEKGDINSLTVLLAFDVNPKSLIGHIKISVFVNSGKHFLLVTESMVT